MVETAHTATVAEALDQLRPGARFWFLFSPALAPPLRVCAWSDQPQLRAFLQAEGAADLSPGDAPFIGLGSMGADGGLAVGGALASATVLAQLAAWARQHVQSHPGLARLKDLTLVTTGTDGTIRARHRLPGLWGGFPALVVPGSLEETARRLTSLRPGRVVRFWLTPRGPDGGPLLRLFSLKAAPGDVAREILRARRLAPGTAPGLQGTAQRTEAGSVLLSSAAPIEEGQGALAALAAHPALAAHLSAVVLARTEGGKIVRAAHHAPPPEAAPAARIASLAPGQAVLLWFSPEGRDGQPRLLLEDSPEALRAAAGAARGPGASLRARLEASADGMRLVPRKPDPALLRTLADWARRHEDRWPALARLRQAAAEATDA